MTSIDRPLDASEGVPRSVAPSPPRGPAVECVLVRTGIKKPSDAGGSLRSRTVPRHESPALGLSQRGISPHPRRGRNKRDNKVTTYEGTPNDIHWCGLMEIGTPNAFRGPSHGFYKRPHDKHESAVFSSQKGTSRQ